MATLPDLSVKINWLFIVVLEFIKLTFRKVLSEASSTNIISVKSWCGDLLITECTVLNNVDQASLWKTIITEVVGNTSTS